MLKHEVTSDVNQNPMRFEELATSMATLTSYAQDPEEICRDMDHLYERALKGPPGYAEITALTGHCLETVDRQQGRAAWLLMNVEGLEVCGVHSRVLHQTGKKFSAPILDQTSHTLGIKSQLTDEQIQSLGDKCSEIDVLGVKDDAIWLVQVVTSDDVIDPVISRVGGNSGKLFRSEVYNSPILKGSRLTSLDAASRQMRLAFPDTNIATQALVLHSSGPDFELYQVDLPSKLPEQIVLEQGNITKNSIDYADKLRANTDSLFTLPRRLENRLFRGVPPCRGGRTLGLLASAVTRQLKSESLMTWKRKGFIQMLREDFDYEIETDKVRHDLDDRLVAQGFFRKWGPCYYVAMKGIVRYQYCLQKFTTKGSPQFDLNLCIHQRDRILNEFGCIN